METGQKGIPRGGLADPVGPRFFNRSGLPRSDRCRRAAIAGGACDGQIASKSRFRLVSALSDGLGLSDWSCDP